MDMYLGTHCKRAPTRQLYSNKFQDQKLAYIHRNPVEAEIVDEPEYYLYSSARDYCGQKGLLDVEIIE